MSDKTRNELEKKWPALSLLLLFFSPLDSRLPNASLSCFATEYPLNEPTEVVRPSVSPFYMTLILFFREILLLLRFNSTTLYTLASMHSSNPWLPPACFRLSRKPERSHIIRPASGLLFSLPFAYQLKKWTFFFFGEVHSLGFFFKCLFRSNPI